MEWGRHSTETCPVNHPTLTIPEQPPGQVGANRLDGMTAEQLKDVEDYVKAGAFLTPEYALYFLISNVPAITGKAKFSTPSLQKVREALELVHGGIFWRKHHDGNGYHHIEDKQLTQWNTALTEALSLLSQPQPQSEVGDKEILNWIATHMRTNYGLKVGGYQFKSELIWQEDRIREAARDAMQAEKGV